MRMKNLLASLFVCGGLALGAFGCAAATTTHVERGELFAAGVAEYDELFAAVHALHDDAQRARFEAEGARAELVRTLDVDNKTDASATVLAAKKRAEALRDKAVLLHVQLAPQPKLVASPEGKASEAELDALVKAVEGAVKSSLEVSERLGALSERAAELESKRLDLAARGPMALADLPKARQDEVLAELAAAKDLLRDDGQQLALSAGEASRFVLNLARALETGAAQAPAPEPTKPARAKPGRGAPGRGAAPARPAPAPTKPPPAAKKPAGGDDFEP
jgi:hypothetical protein